MFRSTTILIMLAMCLATALATSSTNAPNIVAEEDSSAPLKRDKRTFGLDLPLDLGSLINGLKDGVQEMIIDLAISIGKHILRFFHDCKIRLLAKIGKFTLADVFHGMFDPLADLFLQASPKYQQDVVVEPVEVVESAPSFRPSPYAFHPRLSPFSPLFTK